MLAAGRSDDRPPLGVTFKGVDEFRRGGVKSSAMVGTQPLEGRKQITHLFGSGDDWVCVEYDVQASVDGPIVLQNVIVVPAGVSDPPSRRTNDWPTFALAGAVAIAVGGVTGV